MLRIACLLDLTLLANSLIQRKWIRSLVPEFRFYMPVDVIIVRAYQRIFVHLREDHARDVDWMKELAISLKRVRAVL